MNIEFGLATKNDDRELRNLIAANPVPGSISLVYTREPSFFDSVNIMGKTSDIFIARENNHILGQGMVSYLDCYINGVAKEIGYLSSLRLDKRLRSTGCIYKGYDFVKKLSAEKNTPFYLSTIVEENYIARKVLTTNRKSIPQYIDIGRYITYAILFQRSKRKIKKSGYTIDNLRNNSELKPVVDFINKEGSRKQYYPVYTSDDLAGFKGFDYHNLWVCYDHDEIIGVIGVWDQSSFKQTRVHKYQWKWKIIRPFYNSFSYPFGYRKLPKCHEKFEYFFLSFVAIKDNRTDIFESIIKHIYNKYTNSKYHYVVIGFHENDPLNQTLMKFKTIKYNSRMYVVSFKPVDMETLGKTGIPYLECARL